MPDNRSPRQYDKDDDNETEPANIADFLDLVDLCTGGDGDEARIHPGSPLPTAPGILARNYGLHDPRCWRALPRTLVGSCTSFEMASSMRR